ncbi:MAG: thioredoxin domain-containing protein [Chloroflexi bacterium]|nr:thioredoxin domain-containing protein [Chloroflexota bacterium]
MDNNSESAAVETQSRGATAPSKILSYVVVAAACYLLGLVVGGGSLNAPDEAAAVKVDEAQLRAVILSVLEERDLAAADDTAPDRFALVDDDPYLGAEDAPVVIVEFSDFFCTYCKRHFDQTFAPLLESYGQHIRYVYRDFARLTPESGPASEAAQCAFEQGKFWEFRADFFSNQEALGRDFYLETAAAHELDIEAFTACLDDRRYLDEVEIDGLDGQLAGIRGTPGFFINGQILSGAQPYAIFERMTQRELDMAGIDYGG